MTRSTPVESASTGSDGTSGGATVGEEPEPPEQADNSARRGDATTKGIRDIGDNAATQRGRTVAGIESYPWAVAGGDGRTAGRPRARVSPSAVGRSAPSQIEPLCSLLIAAGFCHDRAPCHDPLHPPRVRSPRIHPRLRAAARGAEGHPRAAHRPRGQATQGLGRVARARRSRRDRSPVCRAARAVGQDRDHAHADPARDVLRSGRRREQGRRRWTAAHDGIPFARGLRGARPRRQGREEVRRQGLYARVLAHHGHAWRVHVLRRRIRGRWRRSSAVLRRAHQPVRQAQEGLRCGDRRHVCRSARARYSGRGAVGQRCAMGNEGRADAQWNAQGVDHGSGRCRDEGRGHIVQAEQVQALDRAERSRRRLHQEGCRRRRIDARVDDAEAARPRQGRTAARGAAHLRLGGSLQRVPDDGHGDARLRPEAARTVLRQRSRQWRQRRLRHAVPRRDVARVR